MQKTVVRNPNQSPIRRNLLNIAGIVVQGETIAPQNGDRLLGGYGVAWLNNQDAASQTTGQDNPLPECNCESGGGGGGGSGGDGGVQPSGNCEKKNISELKQVLDDYANQSFCDKEFPEVQFSTFIGYDKPPSDSTAKEIELRMLCHVDDCSDDPEDDEKDTYLYAWAGTNDEDFIYIPCELKSTKEITQTINDILALKTSYCTCDFEDMSPQDWYDHILRDANGKYLSGCYFLTQESSACNEQASDCWDCCNPEDFGFLICVGDDGKNFCW